MKAMALPNNFYASEKNREKSAFYLTQNKWMTGLLISSAAGGVTGLFGLVVNALSLFGFLENAPLVKNLGIWLIVVTFPLGVLTAHCLDKMEAARKAVGRERLRQLK